MLEKEKRIGKVVSFYQSLPDDLLESIINALPVNRDVRRKINKLKISKSKVEMLMASKLRKTFADTAYIVIKHYQRRAVRARLLAQEKDTAGTRRRLPLGRSRPFPHSLSARYGHPQRFDAGSERILSRLQTELILTICTDNHFDLHTFCERGSENLCRKKIIPRANLCQSRAARYSRCSSARC